MTEPAATRAMEVMSTSAVEAIAEASASWIEALQPAEDVSVATDLVVRVVELCGCGAKYK